MKIKENLDLKLTMKNLFINSMSKSLFKVFIIGMFCMCFTRCVEEAKIQEEEIDLANYDVFYDQLLQNYQYIGDQLRVRKTTFSDSEALTKIIQDTYGESSSVFESYINSFEKAELSNSRSQYPDNGLTDLQNETIATILSNLENSVSFESYIDYLDNEFANIYALDISLEDKELLLTFVVSFKASLVYMNDNSDILIDEARTIGRTEGWWSDWGKCAAGIIGGHATGGVAGCGTLGVLGVAIGTPWGPPGVGVGGIIGCWFGGSVGSLGGALTGAATACS